MKIKLSDLHTIYYEPNVYSSFPDIVKTPDEQAVVVFRIGDNHHPKESTIMLSRQTGDQIWESEPLAQANLEEHGFVFNCPRISLVQNRYVIMIDTKDNVKEGNAKWNILASWSEDAMKWSGMHETGIQGIVPDRMISMENSLIVGYHVSEVTRLTTSGTRRQFVQMMAESFDKGETWRDRTTIAVSQKHNFCEGSIVKANNSHLICYMRDNKSSSLYAHITVSADSGRRWGSPQPLDFSGHRVVAGIKKYEPYAGYIVGTFRNTSNKTLSMFVHNPSDNQFNIFAIDTETSFGLFDYGYSGWIEYEDGSLQVVYYIQRNQPNPHIAAVRVTLH